MRSKTIKFEIIIFVNRKSAMGKILFQLLEYAGFRLSPGYCPRYIGPDQVLSTRKPACK